MAKVREHQPDFDLWEKKAVMGLIVQGFSNKELKETNKIKC